MKNKVLEFEKEELDDFIVSDYFSKPVHLIDDIADFSDFLETYRMTDNDKIERISYELYGTTDYWDIIILLNGREALFNMAYDFDMLDESTSFLINFYKANIYSNGILPEERETSLRDEIEDLSDKDNEKYRFIKVPRPARMGDFLRLLKSKGYI